jgi:Phosphatidylethanolamine-binding protein
MPIQLKIISLLAIVSKQAVFQQTRHRRILTAAAAAAPVLLLSASGAWAFSTSFAWCAGSPRFSLQDVPAGTAQLQFAMTDLNKPSFHHGGGTVEYRGQAEVPCGAFAKGFVSPSPPPGEIHTYEFTVKALGGNGAPLATTTFPE